MRDVVLIELAEKWERDAKEPNVTSSNPEYAEANGIFQGKREAKRECAEMLRALIKMLGETGN